MPAERIFCEIMFGIILERKEYEKWSIYNNMSEPPAQYSSL